MRPSHIFQPSNSSARLFFWITKTPMNSKHNTSNSQIAPSARNLAGVNSSAEHNQQIGVDGDQDDLRDEIEPMAVRALHPETPR